MLGNSNQLNQHLNGQQEKKAPAGSGKLPGQALDEHAMLVGVLSWKVSSAEMVAMDVAMSTMMDGFPDAV